MASLYPIATTAKPFFLASCAAVYSLKIGKACSGGALPDSRWHHEIGWQGVKCHHM